MYRVNEIFTAPQGEGGEVGRIMTFVRFSGCNLKCNGDFVDGAYQPVCDTEFTSGVGMSAESIANRCANEGARYVCFTGGEPALSIDQALVEALRKAVPGVRLHCETNGTKPLPQGLDYIAVSPKTAEHTLALTVADELRYVRAVGQHTPKPSIKADRLFISPAWNADGVLRRSNLEWCIELCRERPEWRLSVQVHKLIGVR